MTGPACAWDVDGVEVSPIQQRAVMRDLRRALVDPELDGVVLGRALHGGKWKDGFDSAVECVDARIEHLTGHIEGITAAVPPVAGASARAGLDEAVARLRGFRDVCEAAETGDGWLETPLTRVRQLGEDLRLVLAAVPATTPGDDRGRELGGAGLRAAVRAAVDTANASTAHNPGAELDDLLDALEAALAAPAETEAVGANEDDDERRWAPGEKALHDAYYEGAGMNEGSHDAWAQHRGFSSSGELHAWVDARLAAGGAGGYVWRVGSNRAGWSVVGRLPDDDLPADPREVLTPREGGRGVAEGLCAALNAATPPAPEGDGAALIAAERRRQVEQEGWTPEHDRQHTRGGPRWPSSLAHAATAYMHRNGAWWPWPNRPTLASTPTVADRARELAKAGALIAADLDLLSGTAPARSQAEGAGETAGGER